MANDLTNLIPHIEEVRTRLSQTAATERSMVEQLGDALKRFDQDTLQCIRNVATEHEARRAGIFDELQALAGRIGTFVSAREPVEPVAISQENAQPRAPAAGDWRQATKNLSYEEELDSLIRNGHLLIGKSSPH